MRNQRMGRSAGFVLGLAVVVLPVLAALEWQGSGLARPGHHDYLPPPGDARDGAFRIVAFGSSSTRGYGASAEQKSYPAQLQKLLLAGAGAGAPIEVVNRGVDGEDLEAMLRRLNDDILSRRPNLVIWQIGSNDALHGMSLARFDEGLRRGIDAIRAAGSEVVLMGPQWTPKGATSEGFPHYVDAVRSIGKERNIQVIDRFAIMQQWMRDGLIDQHDLIGPDGLHMTDDGYALLAGTVYRAIMAGSPGLRRAMQVEARPDRAPLGRT